MSQDLLGGFEGQSGDSEDIRAASSTATNGDTPATASFDLLSGSPIKQDPRPVITSLDSTVESSLGNPSENGDATTMDGPGEDTTTTGGASSTSTDSDSLMAFAKPAPPDTELPVAMNEKGDEMSPFSEDGQAAVTNPTLEHQQSINLLDFGGSNDGDGNNAEPSLLKASPPQRPDLFEATNVTSAEANLLDHRDSFAPMNAEEKGDGGLVDLFTPSTSTDPEMPQTTAVTQDPFDAFSATPQPQQTTPTSESDPFGDFSGASTTPDVQEATTTAAPPARSNTDDMVQTFHPSNNQGPSTGANGQVSSNTAADITAKASSAPASEMTTEVRKTLPSTDTAPQVEDPQNESQNSAATSAIKNIGDETLSTMSSNDAASGEDTSSALHTEPSISTSYGGKEETSECREEPQNGEKSGTTESTVATSPAPSIEPLAASSCDTEVNKEQSVKDLQSAASDSKHQKVAESTGDEDVEGSKKDDDAIAAVADKNDNCMSPDSQTSVDSKTTPRKPIPALAAVPPSPVPENSDKEALQQHIQILEKQLHAAHTLIVQFRHHDNAEEERPGDAVMVELQANLQNEMNRRAEAENDMRLAHAECEKVNEEYASFKTSAEESIDTLTKEVEAIKSEKDALLKEVEEIREERDEQARKEMALTTRLNAAKKKEAVKANAAEHYEDQVEELQKQASDFKSALETVTAERDQLQQELGEWKIYAEKRTKQLETALNDEKKLNDERKRKMKGFVEAKTEEVRAAKADYVSLQTELDQTSHSLKELNQRYKQLHAQWVQSQTRNRELQRDMTKMKKDSEKMLKAGGTLEARLSRSAQESEDHRNKRIQAKHELMSVLSQLETERAVNNRLQESIKMTFTPKALSQQQTIQEALDEFEGALQKLSTRLGRPLPPPPMDTTSELLADPIGDHGSDDGSILGTNFDVSDDDDVRSGLSSGTNLSEINTNKALQKLESETRRVSRNIVSFSSSVERMHALLDGAGPRNCVDVFSSMLLGGNSGQNEETRAITGSRRPTTRGGSRYGQVSGTMT
jgi:hypothetical protein